MMATETLSVADRLALLAILPGQGGITTIRLVRQLREDLSFSDEEHKTHNIVTSEGRVTWNGQSVSAAGKEIEIGRKARELIVKALERLDAAEQVEAGHLDIWNRFLPE